jgi:hypothetical protein
VQTARRSAHPQCGGVVYGAVLVAQSGENSKGVEAGGHLGDVDVLRDCDPRKELVP